MKVLKLTGVVALAALAFTNPASANINDFIGVWKNVNNHDRGVIRLTINHSGPSINVHVWGNCQPTPCDWGTVKAMPYGGGVQSPLPAETEVIRAEYKQGFAQRQVIIHKAPNNELRVEVLTHFTDTSGRSDYHDTDLFKK
jgi:hypothetical protein